MELLLQFIFLLALAKYSLKAAMIPRRRVRKLYPLFASLTAYALYPWIIRQRGDSLAVMLADKGLVENFAVLATIEAVLGILFSIYVLDNYFAPKDRRKRSVFVLKVFPGILVFMGIVYFELLFFKSNVGMPFHLTGILYSGIVFAVVSLTSFVLRKLMRGESLKLEAMISLNLIILMAALLMNAALADYNTANSQHQVTWLPFAAFTALFLLFAGTGVLLFKHKQKLKAIIKFKKS